MSIARLPRLGLVALMLVTLMLAAAGTAVRAQPADSMPSESPGRPPAASNTNTNAEKGDAEKGEDADANPAPDRLASGEVTTTLQSRNTVVLELTGKPASLKLGINSRTTGRELKGDIIFRLEADEALEPTDALTCSPSLTLACGVVARFSSARKKPGPATVFEARLEDGAVRIRDGKDFQGFVEGLIRHDSLSVKLRVDQQRDFVFDLRRLAWPLADFGADHPFAKRFARDPVLAALRKRYPARYLNIVTLVRKEVPDTGTLSSEVERKILDALHAAVGSLRPMVSDELLERIVFNASAAAKEVGSRDLALCNALAVAARSSVTAPELKDSQLAKEEYELWHQVVEQAHPRFIRKVPNDDLLPSTPRFEENVRVADQAGCGMFAAVIEAILNLPRNERRLWLRATVGTVEDLRADAMAPRRQ